MSRTKGAFLLVFLILFSCARPRIGLPPPPEAESFAALVRFRLVAPKRRLSGKAVVLIHPGELYVEAFSPFGGALFRFWFEKGRVVWEESPGGPVQAVELQPFPPALVEVLPYLVLGRWPPERSSRLGEGYHLKPDGQGWRLTYFQRTLLRVQVRKPRGIFLEISPLRMKVSLHFQEITPRPPKIPPPPEVVPQPVDLRSFFLPEGD
ncbi:DUF3261 domain-containing protein [Thermosulfurimonas marina]|uniref:DUF3261 domain-containing protein n=1 Tax=Thermosulfurimonas marina TaxID=2047767 RepID=A0A6H1WU13_9BACT|nr:DUF3261 domain-containing protein [Thermosulfurimonas marina]QJA06596.1 DUF3261 domain-containing protein [Thermosulfurimonas marina]